MTRSDAASAAAIFAIDPVGLGGVLLHAAPGPARDAWLAHLAALLPMPPRKLPLHADNARLFGGLDLAATLRTGRAVEQPGLLAEADGGVLVVAMAERLKPALAARLAAVLDTRQVPPPRHGASSAARLGCVALDESLGDDERVAPALAERLALHLALDATVAPDLAAAPDIAAARRCLADVAVGDQATEALCATAAALGIASLRAPALALLVARAAAALAGRNETDAADVELAARLVLAPRARVVPSPPHEDAAPEAETSSSGEHESMNDDETAADRPLPDQVLEAALSALPAHLLQHLRSEAAPRRATARSGVSGASTRSRRRGRPIGSERGDPRSDARLDVLATLRAAAPWQALRQRETGRAGLHWRRDDFRVQRFADRRETTTVFAVDASGSAALHRLAEAKGAVELLLADCYVRRDRVALLAFRGSGAELLLAPTRSLPRAKRCLAALPGGGGTPLAAGIAAAHALVAGVLRQGGGATVVLLTDGRANIARDGRPGRAAARHDALIAARALRGAGVAALLIDTSPQAQAAAGELAAAMGARYLALPHADAALLSRAVGAAINR